MRKYDFEKARTLIDMFGSSVHYATIGIAEAWNSTYYYAYDHINGYTAMFNDQHGSSENFTDDQTPILVIRFTDDHKEEFDCYKENSDETKSIEESIKFFTNLQKQLLGIGGIYTAELSQEFYDIFNCVNTK